MSGVPNVGVYYDALKTFLEARVDPDTSQPLIAEAFRLVRRRMRPDEVHTLPAIAIQHLGITWDPDDTLGEGYTSKEGRCSWRLIFLWELLGEEDIDAVKAATIVAEEIQSHALIETDQFLEVDDGPSPFDIALIADDNDDEATIVEAYALEISHPVTFTK